MNKIVKSLNSVVKIAASVQGRVLKQHNRADKLERDHYLGVRVSAYDETDGSWATLTQNSIGLAESSMTKTD